MRNGSFLRGPAAGNETGEKAELPKHTQASAPVRFEALDGWRGISALFVVFFHAPVAGLVHEIGFFRHGFLFVDFFFVLSGFVITHAFHDRLAAEGGVGRFFAARLFRVYPLHLFMLALFVGFECLTLALKGPQEAFQGGSSLFALIQNLLMIHSFGMLDQLGWNYPSWSISAELLAYALFACFVVGARRALIPVMIVTILVGVVVIAAVAGTIDTTFQLGWLRCLVGFSLGSLLRRLVWRSAPDRVSAGERRNWTLAEGATLLLVLVFVDRFGTGVLSLAAPFVFAFAIFVFAHEAGVVSRLVKSRPIAFLGVISYSIYLTHAFVISRMENVVTVLSSRVGFEITQTAADGQRLMGANEVQALAALAVILAGTLVASALTWRFVERPGMALGRRLLARRGETRAELSRSGARTNTPSSSLR